MASTENPFLKYHERYQTTRQILKQTKRDHQPERVRRKNWVIDDDPDAYEDPDAYSDMDTSDYERVMPRGERERRRANLKAVAVAGKDEDLASAADYLAPPEGATSGPQGVVTEVSTGLCRVELDGRSLLCSLRGSLGTSNGFTNPVAVGDVVIVSSNDFGQGVVESVLPRRSALARPDVSYNHLQQVIAANVDQLLVVAAWRDPAFWPELVDRYLITAERNRLRPIICVNKVDLAADAAECCAALRPYRTLGYPIIFTSAVNGNGISELRSALRERSTVLAGLSGVGKSSLLSAVQPGLNLRVHDVSDRRHEGQHTTTQATLLKLEMGGVVVDTPGIREFGLSALHKRELGSYYPEISQAAEHCRFDDCLHIDEPGCAVRALVRAGWIAAMRNDSYQKILADLPA